MGRIEHLLTAAVLHLLTGHQVPSFSNLCWTIHFFQSFPMLSSPWSPCKHRKSWLAECCSISKTLCPQWGPGGTYRSQAAGSSGRFGQGAATAARPPEPFSGGRQGVLALHSMWAGQCCSSRLWPQGRLLSVTVAKCHLSAVLPISDDWKLIDTPAAGQQPRRTPREATALQLTLKSVRIEIQEPFTEIKYRPWTVWLHLAFEKGKLLQSWHAV